ncbi:hypothetical protein KIPB_010351, partial [Kipferlia bialata]
VRGSAPVPAESVAAQSQSQSQSLVSGTANSSTANSGVCGHVGCSSTRDGAEVRETQRGRGGEADAEADADRDGEGEGETGGERETDAEADAEAERDVAGEVTDGEASPDCHPYPNAHGESRVQEDAIPGDVGDRQADGAWRVPSTVTDLSTPKPPHRKRHAVSSSPSASGGRAAGVSTAVPTVGGGEVVAQTQAVAATRQKPSQMVTPVQGLGLQAPETQAKPQPQPQSQSGSVRATVSIDGGLLMLGDLSCNNGTSDLEPGQDVLGSQLRLSHASLSSEGAPHTGTDESTFFAGTSRITYESCVSESELSSLIIKEDPCGVRTSVAFKVTNATDRLTHRKFTNENLHQTPAFHKAGTLADTGHGFRRPDCTLAGFSYKTEEEERAMDRASLEQYLILKQNYEMMQTGIQREAEQEKAKRQLERGRHSTPTCGGGARVGGGGGYGIGLHLGAEGKQPVFGPGHYTGVATDPNKGQMPDPRLDTPSQALEDAKAKKAASEKEETRRAEPLMHMQVQQGPERDAAQVAKV